MYCRGAKIHAIQHLQHDAYNAIQPILLYVEPLYCKNMNSDFEFICDSDVLNADEFHKSVKYKTKNKITGKMHLFGLSFSLCGGYAHAQG